MFKIVHSFALLAFVNSFVLVAMLELEENKAKKEIERLTFAFEVHKDLYCPMRKILIRNQYVKEIRACDSPTALDTMHVLIKTTHIIKCDPKEKNNIVAGYRMPISKNGKIKLKKILNAYKQLSSYRKNGHIFYNEDTGIQMIGGWQHIFAPDIMEYFYVLAEDLPQLCSLAKIPLNKNLLNT